MLGGIDVVRAGNDTYEGRFVGLSMLGLDPAYRYARDVSEPVPVGIRIGAKYYEIADLGWAPTKVKRGVMDAADLVLINPVTGDTSLSKMEVLLIP